MDFLHSFADVYTLDHIKFLLEGFWVTLKVAAISILLSFIIGGLIGTLRYTKIPVVTQLLTAIVEIIRNLPLLLIIFFTYFALPEIGIEMKIITATIAALTVFESAMISEIIRSGLNSIEKGQIEAARASGLNYIQTLRHIVLPQALRRMVPPLVSQFISLLKDTCLAVVIALPDLLHNGQIIYAQKESYVVPVMVIVSLMYFIVNYVLSLVARRLEIKQS